MDFAKVILSFWAVASLANPINNPGQDTAWEHENKGIHKRQHSSGHTAVKMPAWNYANGTTSDATSDGSVGVIIEPDLDVTKPGKDGAKVKKVRVGPIKVAGGKAQLFMVNRGSFGLVSSLVGAFQGFGVGDVSMETPCTDCYITAMQLGLEYPDGKSANVDTGAW
jgi:hypothetical protein